MPSARTPASLRSFRFSARKYLQTPRRQFSTPNPSSQPTSPPKDAQSRLRRLNDRLPSFLRAYTTPLLGAPATHVTSFLILHEITAVVPLFGLVAAFHYGGWLPDFTSYSGFEEGTRRFGKWLRKRGWVEDVDAEVAQGTDTAVATATEKEGVRLVLEFATAYAVTKALLPLRIAGSVWATPWFARVVLGSVGRGVKRLFRR
ncbi:hypothetical protein BJY04DRAFT_100179 [Aspergillus karnatakaensis]|uniref:uncharacterized protein n=1 Tax=Aspergillus karnatakaensis TaxID=1810916 RepID=UPI003CCCD5B5